MSKSIVRKQAYTKSLAKGILAGLIGGLVATAAKSVAEKFYPPLHDTPDPHALPAKVLTGEDLAIAPEPPAKQYHWGIDALAGAAYGAVAEFYPAAAAREGAGFGVALASFKQDGALPTLGLAPAPTPKPTRIRAREMTTHVIFGVVTEGVRRVVRRMLA